MESITTALHLICSKPKFADAEAVEVGFQPLDASTSSRDTGKPARVRTVIDALWRCYQIHILTSDFPNAIDET